MSKLSAIEELPETLQPGVAARWAGLAAANPELAAAIAAEPRLAQSLPRVWAASEFVADLCTAAGGYLETLLDDGSLLATARADGWPAPRISLELDESAFMAALRAHRQRSMLRIAWRDLAGWAPLEETLESLTSLADDCIETALAYSARTLAARHGWPGMDETGSRNELMVMAMGKLGARELNFSSDIDLVFLYASNGRSEGQRPLDHETWFTRQARHLIRLLDERTADGFVFRVDTRLRPFGDSGPLVISLGAFEAYLQAHGRDWERYAWVKGRALGGSQSQRGAVAELLRPFIYRRYLDYGVFESLRIMKEKVARMSRRKARQQDIKLGPGGIREIEFVVQCYQLIRGGSEPRLREPGLLAALAELAKRGHIDGQTATTLDSHYRYLRVLENRLQAIQDQQVHELPTDEALRARLALAMDCTDWNMLVRQTRSRCQAVHAVFNELVFAPAGHGGEPTPVLALPWESADDEQESLAQLTRAGFGEPGEALARIRALRDGVLYRRLDAAGRRRLNDLMPRMLQAVADTDPDIRVLRHVLAIIESVGRRSAYFSLLNENPEVRGRLVRLCAQSRQLAEEVAAHPVLLDELIDPRVFEMPPTRDDLEAELERRFSGVEPGDLEAQMEALRRFQRASVFRVALADLNQVLPLMKVSDRLTELAELVLDKVLQLAGEQLAEKFGIELQVQDGCYSRFVIIGYGKLGGLELGYGSDLDLVFIYADPENGVSGQASASDGEPDPSVFFTRLGQRSVHMLSTQTRAGRLYDVDTRLRPSGQSGLLVSEIGAFEHYQMQQAWTWEHQALLRARCVAGDAALGKRFATVRKQVLCRERHGDSLRRDIVSMRERMRKELDGSDSKRFDIKQGTGGITDIEFLVQYFVLQHAAGHPGLVRWSDNIRQLEALAAAGLVTPATAETLTDIYRDYRARIHSLSLDGAGPFAGASELADERRFVCQLWAREFNAQSGSEALL